MTPVLPPCDADTEAAGDSRHEQRASLGSGSGSWSNCIDSINLLIADLTPSHADVKTQLSDLKDVATDRHRVLNAVARGDLSQRVMLDKNGRPLEGAFLRSGQVVDVARGPSVTVV
jgi:hypothetical protein